MGEREKLGGIGDLPRRKIEKGERAGGGKKRKRVGERMHGKGWRGDDDCVFRGRETKNVGKTVHIPQNEKKKGRREKRSGREGRKIFSKLEAQLAGGKGWEHTRRVEIGTRHWGWIRGISMGEKIQGGLMQIRRGRSGH